LEYLPVNDFNIRQDDQMLSQPDHPIRLLLNAPQIG